MVESATQEEIEQHLARLNENWQLYDDIKAGQISFLDKGDRANQLHEAGTIFEQEEQWLSSHGILPSSLIYNPVTRLFTLPVPSSL